MVFFHGGGWVAGDLETHDRQARNLAIETGAVVISVDYRRPPETRFPGAFEDAFAAVSDVFGRVAEFGGDAKRLGVAGDSAGGNLAATTAIACRDAGIKLAAQLLVYPVTDVLGQLCGRARERALSLARRECRRLFLSRAVMEWFCGHYLADPSHATDWRVSPLRATSLAGVAPAIVTTAWFDPLRDEGAAYAQALEAAGVQVKHHRGRRADPRLFRPRRRLRGGAGRSAARVRTSRRFSRGAPESDVRSAGSTAPRASIQAPVAGASKKPVA